MELVEVDALPVLDHSFLSQVLIIVEDLLLTFKDELLQRLVKINGLPALSNFLEDLQDVFLLPEGDVHGIHHYKLSILLSQFFHHYLRGLCTIESSVDIIKKYNQYNNVGITQ